MKHTRLFKDALDKICLAIEHELRRSDDFAAVEDESLTDEEVATLRKLEDMIEDLKREK